jgi:mevalonate kinase
LPAPAARLLRRAFSKAAAACGTPKVEVTVESDLPVSMGLGSSAAVSVACARALLQAASRPDGPPHVMRVARLMEGEFHGQPSGVDHTCSVQGGLILFRRAARAEGTFKQVKSPRPLKVLVALVGPRGSTREMVAALKARAEQWPARYRRSFQQVGAVAAEGARAVQQGELELLGDLMNENHGLLHGLGLSSAPVDEMVHGLRRMGALGAKLTGAGGQGGAVVGLFLEPEPVMAKLTAQGVRCFTSQLAGPRTL